ncbi:MAG: YaaA family protein [Patescibacteria group bacterium]
MLTILLHSSKTMRPAPASKDSPQSPGLMARATKLSDHLRSLTVEDIRTCMQLSPVKAEQTHQLIQSWTDDYAVQRPAIDAFLGDIYSGLQVQSFSDQDREYANDHLLILSGLYGGLRALDSIYPYRLEMGYKLPQKEFANLYAFWGDSIAKLIPAKNLVINLSAVEYTKAVLPYIDNQVITPKFLTISKKTGEPTFVTVHAKIARGAFAHWLITNRIQTQRKLVEFSELGYRYDSPLSTAQEPVFVCEEFKGLGLSVRLTQ